MLNGLAPIMIFNFKKLLPQVQALGANTGIPLLADVTNAIPLVPIPIYLSAELTGLYIFEENKNIDVDTRAQTQADGKPAKVQQAGVNSTIEIVARANKDSLGVSVLAAMMDIIFEKLSSAEYSISYLSGAITVFGGLLQGFSIRQDPNTSVYDITIQLSKATGGGTVEAVAPTTLSPVSGPTPGINPAS